MLENIHSFFLITPLGFENIASMELEEKLTYFPTQDINMDIQVLKGGVQFNFKMQYAESLIRILKIPTRVLLRIKSFKAKDGPALFNKSSKMTWNLYLRGKLPKFHISSKESRLFDSRKIENALSASIIQYFKNNPCKEKYIKDPGDSHIFIRINQDTVTLSIALDGQRLDKRGIKTWVNMAPIRENLAVALLYITKKTYPHIQTLIDPMCGSGTFALEAFGLYKKIKRELYIEKLPLYLKYPKEKTIHIDEKFLYQKFCLYDKNQDFLDYAKKNLDKLNINPEFYQIHKRDIFKDQYNHIKSTGIILNPPYGKRITINESLNDYYHNLIKTIFKKLKSDFIGIIIPEDAGFKTKNLIINNSFKFSNGGIKVCYYLIDKPES